jgi:ATP-dependent RNA helicase DeaD
LNTVLFTDWELRQELLDGLAQQGLTNPTPVQQEAFPLVLEGHDLLVQSRTGTGKTYAFGLPILQRQETGHGRVSALVVLPTRELAMQVASSLGRLARPLGIEIAAVYGGGSYRDQHRALNSARIVVGTPGRLCDHLDRGSLDLSECRTLVLDEADEMLDMGFADELDKILAGLPVERQSLLFSATMAPEMRELAAKTLRNPRTLALSTGLSVAAEIQHVGYEVFQEHKIDALVNVLHVERPELAIVFCHTKAETESLVDRLKEEGFKASYLNGDLPQAERTRTLNAFRRRQINLLVATDVAARGIDVKGVSHVFNLGVPHNPETYIHRVGRTGRAGASGQAVTFVHPRDASRFRRMLQNAGVTIELKPVPQAEDVRKKLREGFHEALTAKVAQEAPAGYVSLAQELLAYMAPNDLVAALLQSDDTARACLEAGLDVPVPKVKAKVERKPKAEAPRRVYKQAEDTAEPGKELRVPRKLSEHHEAGMQRIYLNQGKAHRLAPGRLVQLVCSSSGLKGDAIGAIAIHAYYCFFDVKESEAARVVDILNGLSSQGKRLKANLVS